MLVLLWSRRQWGFAAPWLYMVMCQQHLLFGAQMLLCKCSCSQSLVASSPIPVENMDEIMFLGCSADGEGQNGGKQ